MTELVALLGLRLTVPWLELELGVGLCGPLPFLSSLLAVSDEVEPELTPDELLGEKFSLIHYLATRCRTVFKNSFLAASR